MKSCLSEKDYQNYLEDQLSEEELSELKEHIGRCDACKAEFENWSKVKEALGMTSEIQVPSHLKDRVMESVRKASIQPLVQPRPARWAIAALLISALLVLVLPSNGMPFIQTVAERMITYLSMLLYNTLSFIGTDIKTFFSFIKAAIPIVCHYYWVFALSTLLLIVGFITLVLREKAKVKTN